MTIISVDSALGSRLSALGSRLSALGSRLGSARLGSARGTRLPGGGLNGRTDHPRVDARHSPAGHHQPRHTPEWVDMGGRRGPVHSACRRLGAGVRQKLAMLLAGRDAALHAPSGVAVGHSDDGSQRRVRDLRGGRGCGVTGDLGRRQHRRESARHWCRMVGFSLDSLSRSLPFRLARHADQLILVASGERPTGACRAVRYGRPRHLGAVRRGGDHGGSGAAASSGRADLLAVRVHGVRGIISQFEASGGSPGRLGRGRVPVRPGVSEWGRGTADDRPTVQSRAVRVGHVSRDHLQGPGDCARAGAVPRPVRLTGVPSLTLGGVL